MKGELDDIDIKVLVELLEDGRIPAKQLANKIHVHPNTLLIRLKKLKALGIIEKYSTKLDFVKLGYDIHFMILLKLKNSGMWDPKQFQEIMEMKQLEGLHTITGGWDVMSIWRAKNREDMEGVIKKLALHPQIVRTSTQLIMRTYKSAHQFNPFVEGE